MKGLPNMFHTFVISVLSMGGSTVFLKELHRAGQTSSTQETLIQKPDTNIFIDSDIHFPVTKVYEVRRKPN